ncbi:MAG: DUF3343 domain-containing protein [Treponema sp.]|nr:DUF3343 domain-containing protein [Treponema sp.]
MNYTGELEKKAELIICFQSAAQSIMAEHLLLEQAFNVRIMPAPSEIITGCGFCLRLPPEDLEKAAAFLLEQGFSIPEAYLREPLDGSGSYKRVYSMRVR